jgi:hypothetical protein
VSGFSLSRSHEPSSAHWTPAIAIGSANQSNNPNTRAPRPPRRDRWCLRWSKLRAGVLRVLRMHSSSNRLQRSLRRQMPPIREWFSYGGRIAGDTYLARMDFGSGCQPPIGCYLLSTKASFFENLRRASSLNHQLAGCSIETVRTALRQWIRSFHLDRFLRGYNLRS